MNSERCRILKEGILCVKFPPSSPERVLQKAWRKFWACAIILYPRGRGEPHFILQLMTSSQEKQVQAIKASRDGLRLFRCRSKSRPLKTWAMSSGSSLLIYLAADTEQETQMWMQAIRDGLWPPIHSLTADSIHTVSLIDDEKSSSAGILGLYGKLVRTSDGMINIIHPHWQGVLLRWKPEDIMDVRVVRVVGEECEAGVFKITLRSLYKGGRTLHFYSDTARSAVTWIQPKCMDTETLKNLEINPSLSSEHPDVSSSLVQLDTPVPTEEPIYGAIKKVEKQADITQRDEMENITQRDNEEHIKENSLKNKCSKEQLTTKISDEFLDTSINTFLLQRKTTVDQSEDIQTSLQKIDDEIDSNSSSDEMYEHIYEGIASRTNSIGGYTLYEEVNDTEGEYVPPLPPQLPSRALEKKSSLRLLKLSDSVMEALKIAEESPALIEPQHLSTAMKKVGSDKVSSSEMNAMIESIPKINKKSLKRTKSATNSSSKSNLLSDQKTKSKISEKIIRKISRHSSEEGVLNDDRNINKTEAMLNSTTPSEDSFNCSKNTSTAQKRLEADYIDMR